MHAPQTTLNQIHKKLATEWAHYLWDHLSNLYQDHPWKNFPTNTPPQTPWLATPTTPKETPPAHDADTPTHTPATTTPDPNIITYTLTYEDYNPENWEGPDWNTVEPPEPQ